ncbi:unnamed protein product [Microthlaspi erraticum]|uniref:Cystatin domain-containing protein n=1 Tax=Microthlaspi erraticum TaxID=1685480 RepID=A0A6D2I2Z1_9BRAS|nr:unnamed protein product [Microthlaspi erraticum]
MKKLTIDEGDGDSSSDDSLVSLGDLGSDSEWLAYKYFPDREPEWGYDSFEGQELKIHPLVRKTYQTQELYDQYYEKRRLAFESKGFLSDPTRAIYDVYMEGSMRGHNSARDWVAYLANLCVQKYNETEGKTVELVNVVRATHIGLGKWKMYITFMAREHYDGPLVEYQAKVIYDFAEVDPPFPILCRPSPKSNI